MAFWNKKKKDEEESTQPSSSTDSAPTSRAARAVRDLFNATVQGTQKAVQADQAVAQAGQKKLADAAQNLYAATVRGQQAATQANQAVAQAQSQRVQNAAQGIYSAYQQQQERAARNQMAQQQAQMQAPSQRAQDAAQGLYSAYLSQQQSGMPQIQAPTQRAAEAAQGLYSAGLKNIGTRRYSSAPEQRGNLSVNPEDRGRVQNPDGSYSTVDTFSREQDGMEVLVPSVIKVNGQWKHVDEDTAWQHYLRTGENFGKFRTPEEADAYARQLHEYHENYYADQDEQDDGILANLFRQQAGELEAQENVRKGMIDSLKKAGGAVFNAAPGAIAAGVNQIASASEPVDINITEDTDLDALRYQLQQAGYGDKVIEQIIATGKIDPQARYNVQQDDSFWGQAAANYNLGNLSNQADILIGQGIIRGNQEWIDRGYELKALAERYQQDQEGALSHDSGTLGNMLAGELAQHMPQELYQQIAALPYQWMSKLGKYGEAGAQALGTGSLSYTTMAGAAYTDLVERGVDPETAVKMAKDEAAVSSAIEMRDTFIDWAFGPMAGINPFSGVSEKMTRSLLGRILVGMGKWALNVGQETAEEAAQEIVSMANERRAAEGKTDGGWPELVKYFMLEAKDRAPELYSALKGEDITEEADRIIQAGRGGGIVAAFMGLIGQAGGAITTRTNRARANEYLNNIVEAADAGVLGSMSEQDLNDAAETARVLNRDDAVEVFENELARRNEEQTSAMGRTAEDTEQLQQFAAEREEQSGETQDQEQGWQDRIAAAMDRMEAEQGDVDYDQDAAFIDTSGNPVLWNTTDQRHAALLNGSGGLNAAINDGYIRIKQGEGIELAIDNGVLSPQQAQAIRKLVDGFTGNTFRVDLEALAGDSTQTIGALSFEGADIDGRKIVDAINREIRRNAQQAQANPMAVSDSGEYGEGVPNVQIGKGPSALNRGDQTAGTILAKRINDIQDMAPVKTLTGNEINDRSKPLDQQISEFFDSFGGQVERDGLGPVIFGEYGIGGILNHKPITRAKIMTLASVPDVVRNGRIINYDPNWKGRGYPSLMIGAPVNVGGKTIYVAAVIDQRDGYKFYLNECVDSDGNYIRITEDPSDSTKSGVTVQDGITRGSEGSSDNSIHYSEGNGNTENSTRDSAEGYGNLSGVERSAVEHFGTTDDFRTAGYMLTDGTMLDFSGAHWLEGYDDNYLADWRRKNDIRQVDHEDIFEAYEAMGDEFPNDSALDFMRRGNIRMVPEGPGLEIATAKEPTAAQYRMIKRYVQEMADGRSFTIDLTKNRRSNDGTLRYIGNVNPDRVVNDIKHFFRTGEVRQQSSVMQFRDQADYADELKARHPEYANNEESLQLAAGGVDDLQYSLFDEDYVSGWSGERGTVQTAEEAGQQIRKRGKGITDEFVRTGYVELRGQRVRSPQELAELCQILRDPRFETFRVVLTKGDEIVSVRSVSSRLPDTAAVTTRGRGTAQTIWEIQDRMRRTGADGYYLMHNHPSGVVEASEADLFTTGVFINRLGREGYKGHIILDHTEFGLIEDIPEYNERAGATLPKASIHEIPGVSGNDPTRVQSADNSAIGGNIMKSADVARYGRDLQTSDDVTVIMFRGPHGEVTGAQEILNKTFLNNGEIRGYLRNQMREYGSNGVALYTTNRDVFEMTPDLTRQGYVVDAVFADPSVRQDYYESIRADYGVDPDERYFAGKMLADHQIYANDAGAGYGDIRRQLAEAEREYMEHSDANDAEYDYRAQLNKIDELRRRVQEADSVNAEADNINAEADTNPTVESLEREGSVSRGVGYDAERYGDPNPERGQMGSDGVRTCNTTEDLEAELLDVGEAKYRNETGEYAARIRAKSDSGYLLTINRDGKRDTSRSFGNMGEAAAYAASYIEGQTQARTDAELDNEKSAPVRKQEPIEALTTGQVQDEAKRQKQNKAAEASTQSLRDRIRKADEEIKALRRLEKTTGLTETQAKHKADLQETLEILNDELTARKGRAKAKKEKVEVKGNKPVRSAAEAKNRLMDIFHTAPGQRADTNTKLDAKLAEITSSGKITEQNRQDILDMLIDAGMVRQEAEQEFRDVRDWLRGSRIYVSEHDRADFGDDWDGLRKSAWANGIYLTNNESDRSVDSVVSELAETFGTNMFPTDDAASDMLRNLIEQAGKGRSSMITFAEAVNNEARMEHVDPQEIWNDLSRQVDETLKTYAEKAKLEVDLKDRTASMLATERKRAENRIERMAQRRREGEIREKTFKAIRRLKKLRGKAASEVKTQIDEAIRDIDTQARQLTINGLEDLQELARVYDDAKKAAGYVDEENPGNFISNPYIEEKLNRLTQKHINEMDIDDVIELGRVVSALENTVKTNGKMIGEAFDSEVKNVAEAVNAEVQSSKGAKSAGLGKAMQTWFAEEQLSPRRFLELLGGWKKGAMANLADSLEKGQTRMLDFQRRAAQSMDPFMSKKENKEWLKTASGKKAKWYTYSVANGMAVDGSGVTGQSIEITPMMKVSLYLASLNEDNLRHIQTGGLVIPDKALYLKGKTQEAFAQGKRVKMQPQAVRAIASSLTQEEKTFAGYLQKFFNTQSKDAINEVSLQLDGFERADVDQYFPIESSRAFLKSDVSGEARAQTVEGIGSIANERVHASNPIVLDDAYNVFMRQVDKVSRYYGYAIPIRNFQAVNNYVFHEEGNAFAGSIKDTINRKWGAGAENYITKMLADIQGGTRKSDVLGSALSKLRGNLAGATLTLNPSVAVSQTASYPGAAQAVGWDGLAAGLTGRVDEKLIEKYTPLLWYRSQGYSTQEIGDAVSAQNKTLAQKALASKALNWIQTMDRLAVKRIWKAAEYRVTKDTGLKPGSKELIDSGMDPYYRKVAEVFNRAVYDTQPNYTDMERAQILRSDSDITKFLTMYKTVPLQYYGMTAEAVGRMQAALKTGDKNEIRAARKYAANTFGGLLAANSVYVAMKALFKSFRGKDKDYRDEEGNVTAESYLKQLGKDLMETYAGSIIGGAEAYSLADGWIHGEKFSAPEINVLSSVEDIANGFQSIFKAIDDDDPSKTAKAIKDAAENIAMVFGMPVKNVETYLMAAIRYIQPQAAMQYDSFFGGLSKGDLKNMDADTIGSAASVIMNGRTGVNMERAATDELSRLYAAGFTDAIPTAIPDSFEYGGNTVKIKDRKAYRETWGGVVGDNLEELTASRSYTDADDKTKEVMIRKLYQYATVQARMGADPEYTVEGNSTYGWTQKADDAMESGMDLPTVIAAMTTMNAMSADKVNGQTVKSKKTKAVEYIDSLQLDTEQKDALYELAGYESGLEKAPWHSGISAEEGYSTGTKKPMINEDARKRAVAANYDLLTSSAAYKAADDQTKKEMIEKLNQYAEVQGMVTTDPDYLPTGSAGWTIWAEAAEKAGIDLISAIDYATQLDSFKADYNEYGKAISGSKKDKVTKYIDSLDLSNDQKDVLYLKIYAENSLKYTPWHGYTGKKKKRRGGRRGGGRKGSTAKSTKPKSVGKITPKYATGVDVSKLFGLPSSTGKSGTAKAGGLSTDLAKIVNSGLDISELFKYTPTKKAPKGRTQVDFKL